MHPSKAVLGLIPVAASVWPGAAPAQSVPETAPPPATAPSFAFGLGAASDGLFRGVSRTDDRAQLFGSIDGSYADGYAGIWVSNAAFKGAGPARTGAEIDVYGGWRPEAFGYSLDLGAQYDAFAGQPSGASLAYAELYAKISRTIGPVTGRFGLRYSPAFAAHAGQAWYGEAGADYVFIRDWTASVGVGRQTGGRPTAVGGGDYLTWTTVLTRALGQHLAVDLRYSDTDQHRYGQAYDARLVGEIRASF
jgi:uncharacterized protein (TIGR02001 family)